MLHAQLEWTNATGHQQLNVTPKGVPHLALGEPAATTARTGAAFVRHLWKKGGGQNGVSEVDGAKEGVWGTRRDG